MTPPCHNRPDYDQTVRVPNGWSLAGLRVFTTIPHRMSTECKQHGPYGAARIYGWDCTGCRHMPGAPKPIPTDSRLSDEEIQRRHHARTIGRKYGTN